MRKVLFNWSGGKDSSLGLYKLLQSGDYDVCGLLTSVNREKGRVSMHGIREELIRIQAQEISMPLHILSLPGRVGMEEYDQLMMDMLLPLKEEGIAHCAFGDIFLDDLRAYREERLNDVDMTAIFPLWKISTTQLAKEFIDLGFKAVISCIDSSKLDASFVGREFDQQFLEDLPEDVDPCGENGEFHSFVYDGPIFENPVPVKRGEIVDRTYKFSEDSDHSFSGDSKTRSNFSFRFIDLLPD